MGELLVPVSTPMSALVPEAVVMVPPMSEAAICVPVGDATPREIRFWRAASSTRAASPGSTKFAGVKVTICREPSAPTVASVTAVPVVRPVTRLSKLPVEPANGMSCGATNCTCCVDGEKVVVPREALGAVPGDRFIVCARAAGLSARAVSAVRSVLDMADPFASCPANV